MHARTCRVSPAFQRQQAAWSPSNTRASRVCPSGKFCVALEAAEGQRTPDTWRGEDAGGEEQAWPQDSQDWSAAEEGGSWKQAAATFFTSYPSCCGQDDWEGGDDSECTDYNGCQVGERQAGGGRRAPRVMHGKPG